MLTQRQKNVLTFIRDYQKRAGGVTPSRREIAAGVNLKSVGNIVEVIDALEERGFIRRLAGRARAIEILKPVPGGKEPPRDTGRIPIYDAATHQLRGYLP